MGSARYWALSVAGSGERSPPWEWLTLGTERGGRGSRTGGDSYPPPYTRGDPIVLARTVSPKLKRHRSRPPKKIELTPVGVIHSSLKTREEAPRFYTEGAPDAILEIVPEFRRGLGRVRAGDELIVITWLHRARRDVLRTHPRGDRSRPLTGVFLTRSPDRPNPLGLHRCRVLEVSASGLRIGPIEAIDGTPVVDIKSVVSSGDDS